MERVLVLGAGPQARIIPDIVAASDNLELLGFVDTGEGRRFLKDDGSHFPLHEGAGFPEELKLKLGDFSVLIANDHPDVRSRLITEVAEAGLRLANIIHPGAIVSPSARLGGGILIAPGVIIGPGTKIGNHVILNSAATLDHDSVLEDNVIIGPGVHLAGGTRVDTRAFIGVGACSVPGVTIGCNCLIGAGSVITTDIEDNVVAAGVPAKVIRVRS